MEFPGDNQLAFHTNLLFFIYSQLKFGLEDFFAFQIPALLFGIYVIYGILTDEFGSRSKMSDGQQNGASKGPTAPYIAFQSIKTMSKDMKQHGIPNRIDRSVLTNFSGMVGGQLLTTLKFLGLTDDQNHPTDRLRALVQAYDTDTWAQELGGVVRDAYAPVFQLNLESASPSQFTETFRRAYPGADAVQRKSMTFFLNAVRDAQIKISAYIMKNKKPRSAPAKRRPVKTGAAPADQAQGQTPPPPPPPPGGGHRHGSADAQAFERELLAKFPPFDPAWSDEIKTQWFAGFQQFMGMAKGQPSKD